MARLVMLGFLLLAWPAWADERVALFPFELINTSPAATTPEETARAATLDDAVRGLLAKHGVALIDTAPVAAKVAETGSLRDCNGCELDLARDLGAELAAIGWVQKVSNLILNINMQVREVATGRLVHAGSVDIRGNTDESWQRGLTYLVNRRLYPSG